MSDREKNFNAVNYSSRIITPSDATIVKEANNFLNADNPEEVLESLDLIFNGFLTSEFSDDQEIRSNCLYRYNLTRNFLGYLVNDSKN